MERCLKLLLAGGLLAGLVGVSQPLAQGQTKSPTAVTPADYLRWVSNESGHACKGPLFSNLFREAALPDAAPDVPADACGGARSPGRISGVAILDLQAALVGREE